MRVKDSSVNLEGLHISMRKVLHVVEQVYRRFGQEPVITAGREVVNGKGEFIHSAGSFHNFGRALDFRTYYFDPSDVPVIVEELKNVLGDDYDIVMESSHLHIEYDPI